MYATPIKLNLIGEFPVHVLDEQLQDVMRQIQQQTQAQRANLMFITVLTTDNPKAALMMVYQIIFQ